MRPRRSAQRWKGIKKSIGNNGFANSPGDPPAFCFYRPHQAGQGTYQMGFRMPWPIVGPYTLMGPEEWDYSHLCRQDRFTQAWLETQGYDYDVLSDTDLHLDPHVLDGYRVLFVVGHSEYWSFDAMDAVSRFLDRGGNAIVLSGNTAFWRVSFNADASDHRVPQGRRARDPGPRRSPRRDVAQPRRTPRRDVRANAGSRPGGCSAWSTSRSSASVCRGSARTGSATPDHFLFRRPERPEAARRRPVWRHARDVRCRSRSAMRAMRGSRRSRSSWSSRLRTAEPSPSRIRPASRLLAEGYRGLAEDRLRLGLFPAAGPAGQEPADLRRGRDDLLGAARRRARVSRRIDQRRLDARERIRSGPA